MSVHTVFALDTMESGGAQKVTLDGRDILLVRIEDDVYALSDTCSHADVSLSDGFVEADDRAIECPKHGASFDLKTGEALSLPAIRPVPIYDVAVVDGDVVVTLTPEEDT